MPKTNLETTAQAVLKQCLQSASSNINKKKGNERVREVSHASRFTHPYVNLSSNSFFGSFFVENSRQVSHVSV